MASPWTDPTTTALMPLTAKRGFDNDSFTVFNRKLHAHACMMSIVFIVLFPLGAITPHLPLQSRVRRVITRLHAPIQLLGLAMMIGALGLGINIAETDLGLFSSGQQANVHIVLGLVITCAIIVFQPALGLLQHLHFKKYAHRSWWSHVHRWLGRIMIVLGWANSWLGFELAGWEYVSTGTIVRNAVLMGVLGAVWWGLVGWDGWRFYFAKKDKLGAYGLVWERGFVLRKGGVGDNGEEGFEKSGPA